MIKAVKFLNLVSVFLFAVVLLAIYAYLPISVNLDIDGVGSVHKQQFFYYSAVAFIVPNILLRVILNLGFKSVSENVLAWMFGLIFVVNLYLTFLIGFVGVLNNASSISPSNYAYLNFLGPLFVLIWIGGLIFLVVKRR